MSDEAAPVADKAMSRVVEEGGVVPGIWWYELRIGGVKYSGAERSEYNVKL